MTRKCAITAEDLYRLRIPKELAMAPSEELVAYTVERMDREKKTYYANLWLCNANEGRPRRFTHGDHYDKLPVFSPDSTTIAFLSKREKKSGIYIIPVDGGAEKCLIEFEGDVTHLLWSPDGRYLVMPLRFHDSHYVVDDARKHEPPIYRHITRLAYKYDGQGWRPKDRFQIFTLQVDSGDLRQITSGKRDNMMPHISPNGKWICYTSNRHRNPELNSLHMDVFVIPFGGGRERRVPTPTGPIYGPRFSPDNGSLAYIGHDQPDSPWNVAPLHIWKVGLDGSPKARDLMPDYHHMAVDQTLSDVGEFGVQPLIRWSADGKRIYFLASDAGRTGLLYVPNAGGMPKTVFESESHIKDFSIAGKRHKAALIWSDLENPGDILVCPLSAGAHKKAKRLTDLNSFIATETKLGHTSELWIESFDGTSVQAWVTKPPDFRKNRKYPAILEIHGGPRKQFAFTFFHEMQYLAAQGYIVVYSNPRGGSGRGPTWAESIVADWGSLDYRDLMAATDWMASQKFIDKNRLGVTGGSYGGYMTNWIVGHTDRFKAAITQRSLSNLASFVGTSDVGYTFQREFKSWPWTDPALYENRSPIAHLRKVKTPVLIIHSEQDLRCPIEQAEQMFVMLKALGKTVEMVRFPEESHGLSRHGRPDRRIARLEWIKKWFDRYLK